jgi:membrane protein YqaA with SNARE-associated domain
MTSAQRLKVLRLLALLVVIGLSVFIFAIRDQAEALAQYGYAGIFLLSILANATIILPAPGIAIVFAMGGVFNPVGTALAAAAGSTIGELSGYLAGFSGRGVIENQALYDRLIGWMQHNRLIGLLAIFVLAAIPNPLFDMAGIAAGALKIPVWQFLLSCGLGKTIKMLIFAYAGYYSIDWLL